MKAGTNAPPPPIVCPTPPDLDYSLGYYSSGSQGKTEFVQFTYTNPGPNTITDLAGEFDVEAPWTRNALGTRTGGFIKGLRWQTTVSGVPSGFTAPGTPLTVNDSTATPATTWYDDATMDSLGNLSIRDVPFSISGLALAPGDSITLRWDGSNGGSNHKNILAAIDNFVLNDTTGGGSSLLYSQDFDAAGQAALAAVGPEGTPDIPALRLRPDGRSGPIPQMCPNCMSPMGPALYGVAFLPATMPLLRLPFRPASSPPRIRRSSARTRQRPCRLTSTTSPICMATSLR